MNKVLHIDKEWYIKFHGSEVYVRLHGEWWKKLEEFAEMHSDRQLPKALQIILKNRKVLKKFDLDY